MATECMVLNVTGWKDLMIIIAAAALATTAAGRTIYVDDDAPADFTTIQAAIDDVDDGDTVVVRQGTYFENIRFNGKNITVTGASPKDPTVVAATIIDGGNIDSAVTFTGTEDPTCVLTGLTIQRGHQDSGTELGGGGICGGTETQHTHATIIDNAIIDNFAWDGGGLSRCDGLVAGNLIAGNKARWWRGGGGLYQCNGIIRNNIIAGNSGFGCDGGGAMNTCSAVVENCTMVYNTSEGFGVVAFCDGPMRNCIIWGNTPPLALPHPPVPYTEVDPLFADPGYWDPNGTPDNSGDDFFVPGDYHLKSQGGRYDPATQSWVYDDVTSPCIDAGDPMTPIGPEPFPNGGIANMGAYSGTSEASKSYFGKPPCKTIVAGDVNGDCVVNFKDMAIMMMHWLEER